MSEHPDPDHGRKCRVIIDNCLFNHYEDLGRRFVVSSTVNGVAVDLAYRSPHARVEWIEDVREGDRVIDADGKWWTKGKDSGGTTFWHSSVGAITHYDEAVNRPFRKQFREDGTEVSQ